MSITRRNNNVKLNLFADDTVICICTENLNDGIQEINRTLMDVSKYLKINKMKLNMNKTKAMIISNINKKVDKANVKIKIDNEQIELVNEIKYLKIFIDEKLNFNKNTDYICKKASAKEGMLKRLISRKTGIEERICTYKTIVAPHFEYCASINFLCNDNQMNRMQKLQNRAILMYTQT